MVGIFVPPEAKNVTIVGCGINLPCDYELSDGLTLVKEIPIVDYSEAAKGADNFLDYAAVILGEGSATFALRIDCYKSPKELAVRSWNALWDFHLLSLAAQSPVYSIYSVAEGSTVSIRSANRGLIRRPIKSEQSIAKESLDWARTNKSNFDLLIKDPVFGTAMRCYGNAHHLHDLDMRIMLIWSGIERLLGVDSELSRRIALYSSIIIPGSKIERMENFKKVKKLYNVRSAAVHGKGATQSSLQEGYHGASILLSGLLRRCVEIGRVPTTAELDELALSQAVS